VEKVDGGVSLVRDTGEIMGGMVQSFEKLTKLITDIADASKEQSSGIDQVTIAIGQMDEVTQQNAALVEQAAAAAESLEEQARIQAETLSRFKLPGAPERGQARLAAPKPSLRASKPSLSENRPKAPTHALSSSKMQEDEWEEF